MGVSLWPQHQPKGKSPGPLQGPHDNNQIFDFWKYYPVQFEFRTWRYGSTQSELWLTRFKVLKFPFSTQENPHSCGNNWIMQATCPATWPLGCETHFTPVRTLVAPICVCFTRSQRASGLEGIRAVQALWIIRNVRTSLGTDFRNNWLASQFFWGAKCVWMFWLRLMKQNSALESSF